jgi:hypothetical protein
MIGSGKSLSFLNPFRQERLEISLSKLKQEVVRVALLFSSEARVQSTLRLPTHFLDFQRYFQHVYFYRTKSEHEEWSRDGVSNGRLRVMKGTSRPRRWTGILCEHIETRHGC